LQRVQDGAQRLSADFLQKELARYAIRLSRFNHVVIAFPFGTSGSSFFHASFKTGRQAF
jgi:hypothetical protein